MFADGERRPQHVELRTHAHARARAFHLRLDVGAVDERASASAVAAKEAREHGNGGRLPRAVVSEERRHPTATSDKTKAVHRGDAPERDHEISRANRRGFPDGGVGLHAAG